MFNSSNEFHLDMLHSNVAYTWIRIMSSAYNNKSDCLFFVFNDYLINNHQQCGFNNWVSKDEYEKEKNSVVSSENDITNQEKTIFMPYQYTVWQYPLSKTIYKVYF